MRLGREGEREAGGHVYMDKVIGIRIVVCIECTARDEAAKRSEPYDFTSSCFNDGSEENGGCMCNCT